MPAIYDGVLQIWPENIKICDVCLYHPRPATRGLPSKEEGVTGVSSKLERYLQTCRPPARVTM